MGFVLEIGVRLSKMTKNNVWKISYSDLLGSFLPGRLIRNSHGSQCKNTTRIWESIKSIIGLEMRTYTHGATTRRRYLWILFKCWPRVRPMPLYSNAHFDLQILHSISYCIYPWRHWMYIGRSMMIVEHDHRQYHRRRDHKHNTVEIGSWRFVHDAVVLILWFWWADHGARVHFQFRMVRVRDSMRRIHSRQYWIVHIAFDVSIVSFSRNRVKILWIEKSLVLSWRARVSARVCMCGCVLKKGHSILFVQIDSEDVNENRTICPG